MMKPYSAALPALLAACAVAFSLGSGCGGDVEETSSTASTGTGGAGGAGGGISGCSTIKCGEPGEVCVAGACLVDCREPGSVPCAEGTACDVSDASPGQCVALGTPCLTTSEPEACGDRVCGPGAACDGAGKCYPRVPCATVICEGNNCYGSACACSRSAVCEPAPLGSVDAAGNGEVGTLHDNVFRSGIVDLEFDPACGAWAVTLLSGPDYLRSIGTDGKVTTYTGVTNLNMGEVAVLQQIITPRSGPTIDFQDAAGLDVALSYICCETCGCIINSSQPQGVARLDPTTGMLPIVIPSETYTKGTGPYGANVTDTGPAGVTYGLDQVLYVGNVKVNGDYYRLDLKTQAQTLVATLPARVYASAPFDAVTMLVALEGGDIHLVRPGSGEVTKWATSDQPVTGMIRDFFDGSIYIARFDGSILKYDEKGTASAFQTSKYPARLSIAPNGWLYALASPPPYYAHKPIIERWELPKTR
ncbi:MAG TPA: hypothetical protein VK459_03600 [Polyangiaceae bacterium]|nr:hypothetical protein [Polyangiaceae bacterium]